MLDALLDDVLHALLLNGVHLVVVGVQVGQTVQRFVHEGARVHQQFCVRGVVAAQEAHHIVPRFLPCKSHRNCKIVTQKRETTFYFSCASNFVHFLFIVFIRYKRVKKHEI